MLAPVTLTKQHRNSKIHKCGIQLMLVRTDAKQKTHVCGIPQTITMACTGHERWARNALVQAVGYLLVMYRIPRRSLDLEFGKQMHAET